MFSIFAADQNHNLKRLTKKSSHIQPKILLPNTHSIVSSSRLFSDFFLASSHIRRVYWTEDLATCRFLPILNIKKLAIKWWTSCLPNVPRTLDTFGGTQQTFSQRKFCQVHWQWTCDEDFFLKYPKWLANEPNKLRGIWGYFRLKFRLTFFHCVSLVHDFSLKFGYSEMATKFEKTFHLEFDAT